MKGALFLMPKLPLHIEVVRSSLKHISSMSEASARDIVTLLRQYYSDVIMTNVDTLEDLQTLIERKPDLVFAGIYFVFDEQHNNAKVWLADVLEQHGIAYTGSGKHANRLSLNKHLAKQRMVEQSIRTAAFKLFRREDTDAVHQGTLNFPLFVKPSNKSGGQGVDEFSIVYTTDQLQNKVRYIHEKHSTDALVEEYLSGREFSIAVIGGLNNSFVAMPLELIAAKDSNGDRIRSHEVKSSNAEDMNEIPNPIERSMLEKFAVDAFSALGGVGYGRVDIRFNAVGVPHFLEANHIPSLIQIDSSFLKAYQMAIGKDYASMILRIITLALERDYTPILHERVLPKL
jgi:D-alanine-D-alanine ligase